MTQWQGKKIWLVSCLFGFFIIIIIFFNFFYFLKGEYYTIVLLWKKKCITDLSNCYIQLLFRCYYSISSSVDYQRSVLFWEFTFNTVFVALGPQQNWSDSTCLLFKMVISDKNIFHHKSYKQEVLIWSWLFWRQ